MQTILQILIALVFSHLSVSECAKDSNDEVAQMNSVSTTQWVQCHYLEALENSDIA